MARGALTHQSLLPGLTWALWLSLAACLLAPLPRHTMARQGGGLVLAGLGAGGGACLAMAWSGGAWVAGWGALRSSLTACHGPQHRGGGRGKSSAFMEHAWPSWRKPLLCANDA